MIDLGADTVTCPAKATVPIWRGREGDASPTSAMGASPARCPRSALLQQRDAQSASAVMSSGCATHAPNSGNRTGKPTTARPGRKSNASSAI